VDEVITCGGSQYYNLNHLFEYLSDKLTDDKKHFKKFYFNNTAITELKENTFFDLTFDEIEINWASNLTRINSNAFTTTNLVTKKFITNYTPLTSSSPDYDIFHMLSLMVNITRIDLYRTQITEIPPHAFKPLNGYQNKLTYLEFNNSPLKKIGNYAFYDLNSLEKLYFYVNQIDFIPSNAFNLRKPSQTHLEISIAHQQLNGSSFELNAFSNIQRPTRIWFHENPKLNFIDENVFSSFLNSNSENRINFSYDKLDCNDCRSYWLRNKINYLNKIEVLECSNQKKFLDTSNFANCDTII
jgi:hypothetical protein